MPLLERESALETLGGWFAEARAGRGRLVLLGGEAGVGKTALVNEFALQHRQAARVLWGACDPLTTPRPLGPVADVAPALGGRLDQLLRDEAPREVLFGALLERLRDRRVATILVIEDVHWADEATLDLLRFLARRLGATPVLLVVTYRDDEVGPYHRVQLLAGDLASSALVRRLRLAPLSRQAVAALAGPHGLDPRALYETTRGNPFFVTEVLAAGDEAIPATVMDAVLARAARLPQKPGRSWTPPRWWLGRSRPGCWSRRPVPLPPRWTTAWPPGCSRDMPVASASGTSWPAWPWSGRPVRAGAAVRRRAGPGGPGRAAGTPFL
jgi:predicted ATPase